MTVLAALVAANALARLLTPHPAQPGIAYAEIWEYARDVLRTDLTTRRRDFLQSSSMVAAAFELVVALAIIWGVRVRGAVLVLGLTMTAFAVFIFVASKQGWPVVDCGCIAGASQLSVRAHLVMNGLIGLTFAWAYHSLRPTADSASPVARAGHRIA